MEKATGAWQAAGSRAGGRTGCSRVVCVGVGEGVRGGGADDALLGAGASGARTLVWQLCVDALVTEPSVTSTPWQIESRATQSSDKLQ